MKRPLTAVTRPRTSSGEHDERNKRDDQRMRQREHDGGQPESRDRGEYDFASTAPKLPAGQHERHAQGADTGRGAQQAECPGACGVDVAREYRQQRRHAAEQDREQIERDHAEDDALVADIAQPGEKRLQGQRLARRRDAFDVDQECQQDRAGEKREAGAVDDCGTRRITEAAQRRPHDGGGLIGAGGRGGGARHERDRNEVRHHDLHQGDLEGARHTEDERNAEDQLAAHPARHERDEQRSGRDRLDRLAQDQQEAAVVAVGDLSDHQEQQHRRDELDEADQAEIERIVGQRIELPSDRHDEHLVARRDGNPREPEQDE